MAHGRVHPCGLHHSNPGPGGHPRARKDHVPAFGQGSVLGTHRQSVLLHGHGLPGKGRLLRHQLHRAQKPQVRGHQVSCAQEHHVPGHQFRAVYCQLLPRPEDPGLRGAELFQRVYCPVGPKLLDRADNGVNYHYGQYDYGVQKIRVPLHGRGPEGHPGAYKQYQHHKVLELPQKAHEHALAACRAQLVLSVLCKAAGGLGWRKAPVGVRGEGRQGLLDCGIVERHEITPR